MPNIDKNISLKYDFSNGWVNSGLIVLNTNLEPNPILPIVDGLGWIFSIRRWQGRDFVKGPINTNLNYKIVSKKKFSGNFVIQNLLNGTEFGLKINQNEQEDLLISNAEIRSLLIYTIIFSLLKNGCSIHYHF